MSEIISDTSPLQYLHQIGLLHVLHQLAGKITVPPAVVEEIETGLRVGIDLPKIRNLSWISIRQPLSIPVLPLVKELGRGELQTLALALETKKSIVIIDDRLARQIALSLGVRLMGTLRILIDGKKAGYISDVAPLLDQLQSLRFNLDKRTHAMILKLANE